MVVFAFSIGFATFIENDYGTPSARALIFNSWWLELILVFLCAIFLYNIFAYKLYYLRKLPVLLLHLSFIFIMIGAGITRYISEEGVMRIREGNLGNQFISSNLFLEFKIHNSVEQYAGAKELLLSSISNNAFVIPVEFNNQKVRISYDDFIHDPIDDIALNDLQDGEEIIELIIPSPNGGMKSEYLKKYSKKIMQDITVGFESGRDSDFNIFFDNNSLDMPDSVFYFISKHDIEFMRMSDQDRGVLVRNKKHKFNTKVLYTVQDKNFVFKNNFTHAKIIQKSEGLKNDPLKLDLLKIKLSVSEQDTVINLYGGEGKVSSKDYFLFNNLFFSLSYGPRIHTLPFALFLKDFQLERYPGSESPSSFASEIQVVDGEAKFDYRIFMNNVLNYKGYKFFQSSYDTDEKGTILSVNRDKWGTGVTYFGYSCLLFSVLSVMISKFSRINIINKKLNNNI